MSSNAQFIITLFSSLLSSAAIVGVIQHFLTRRQRLNEEARKQRQDVIDTEDAQLKRRELLSAAQATAQETALKSADGRYRRLYKDYTACRHGMAEIANATGILIDEYETHLNRFRLNRAGDSYSATMHAGDMTHARKAIAEARKHLTPGMVPWDEEGIDE